MANLIDQHRDNIRSPYLYNAYNPVVVRKLVRRIVKVLKPIKNTFDVIAFRGMSGALIAPIVAERLGKPLICVRKQDNNHSRMAIEGYTNCESYIIIDDFTCSGTTVKEIIVALANFTMIGAVFYHSVNPYPLSGIEGVPEEAWSYCCFHGQYKIEACFNDHFPILESS